MGVGDFIGPLIFLGIAGYGVWAFANHQFPFNIDTSSLLGSGMTPDLSGLGGDGSMLMMAADPCAACCATGAAGYLSYSGKTKHHSSHSSKKGKHSSKKKKKKSSKGGGGGGGSSSGDGGGGGTTTTMPDMCAGCNCGGGTGAGTLPSSGGGGGGVWGQNPKSKTPCDIPGQSCSPIGSLGGTSNWCKCVAATGAEGEILSEYASYGDYATSGSLIAADVPIAPDLWVSNYAKSGDYGAIGNIISKAADPFRSYQGNYTDSDAYYPVQYGYLGSYTNSRLNQLAGIESLRPTMNPLAEYTDNAIPVAVS
jgi:hypothetical protein